MIVHVHEPGNEELSREIHHLRARDVQSVGWLDGGDPIALDTDSHVALKRTASHVNHRHVILHDLPTYLVLSEDQRRDCRDQAQRRQSGEPCKHGCRVTLIAPVSLVLRLPVMNSGPPRAGQRRSRNTARSQRTGRALTTPRTCRRTSEAPHPLNLELSWVAAW